MRLPRNFPSKIKVLEQDGYFLGLCTYCGHSLGHNPSLDMLAAAAVAHTCDEQDRRDQSQKMTAFGI